MQVVGGGVVGGAFGQLAPLFAFSPPIQQIRAGEHELVAVVAVQLPRAGPAVDDRLEGAEPALGRGGAPRQVDRQRLGLLAGHRGQHRGVGGEKFARVGGAGPGHPDLLQHVFEIRIRQVHIVFGHPIGDLAEVSCGCG